MKFAWAIFVLAASALAQQPCALEGKVVNHLTGTPLAKVRLLAIRQGTGPEVQRSPAIRALTNDQGAFCFASLVVGSYGLLAQRSGFLEAFYKGSRLDDFPPSIKIDPAGSPVSVLVEMTPRSILTGKVVDSDGDPIAGAEVFAEAAAGNAMRRSPGNITTTDLRGTFRFYDLDAGSYLLRVSAPRELLGSDIRDGHGHPLSERQVSAYYASLLNLEAGAELAEITITLQKVSLRHLSGKVIGGSKGLSLMAETTTPSGTTSSVIRIGDDGSFSQYGLLPARYYLRIIGGPEQVVDLTGGDVDGVVIEVSPSKK